MRGGVVLYMMCVLLAASAVAQNVSVSSAQGQNPAAFIQSEMVGSGVHITNVKFNNSSSNIASHQIGTFQSNGFIHLRMGSGVVMTTGNVSVAPGPNNTGSKSVAATPVYSDSQLSSIATGSINACATLDFDFVSVSPYITVNYCFGSEEYPEYVCSNFNDVFAFYITGLDPTTNTVRTWNMAKIPNTTSTQHPDGIPVTINSVNPGQAGASGGSGSGCYYTYSQYYVENNYSTGVQYDGFTQKLSASAVIYPCVQYHMHISLCNVGDNSHDSGVFLEHGSFNSPQAQVSLAPPTFDTLRRSRSVTVPIGLDNTDYSYGAVTLTFAGNALVGREYICVTDQGDTLNTQHRTFTLLNSDVRYLTFSGLPTALLDEPRNIEIQLATSLCQNYADLCTYDTIRGVIAEDDVVRLRDTVIHAEGECTSVGVEVDYALRPLHFQWIPETGIYFPQQQYSAASITEDASYRVAAWDAMGNTDTAEVQVLISPVGIGSVDAGNPMLVYPNPADDRLVVEAEGLLRVELTDVEGRTVAVADADGLRAMVGTHGIPSGVYTARGVTADRVMMAQVVVNH